MSKKKEPGERPEGGEQFEQAPMGGNMLPDKATKRISRKKYDQAVQDFETLARIKSTEESARFVRYKNFKGYKEPEQVDFPPHYIDESLAALPGMAYPLFVIMRGVRDEMGHPEGQRLSVPEEIGAYHIAVGLGDLRRSIIVNSTSRAVINAIRKYIIDDLRESGEPPYDILNGLLHDSQYSGKKARNNPDLDLIVWARDAINVSDEVKQDLSHSRDTTNNL